MSSKHVFDSVPLCARVFCCGIEDIEFLQDFIPPKVPIRKPFSATPFSITVSLKHKSLFESMTCITRQFRFAYALRTKLADPAFVKEAEELSINMTTKRFTDEIIKQIKDHPREASEYGADTGQVRLLTECNFKVLLIAWWSWNKPDFNCGCRRKQRINDQFYQQRIWSNGSFWKIRNRLQRSCKKLVGFIHCFSLDERFFNLRIQKLLWVWAFESQLHWTGKAPSFKYVPNDHLQQKDPRSQGLPGCFWRLENLLGGCSSPLAQFELQPNNKGSNRLSPSTQPIHSPGHIIRKRLSAGCPGRTSTNRS